MFKFWFDLYRFHLGGDTLLTICDENIKLRQKTSSGPCVWYGSQIQVQLIKQECGTIRS